MDCHEILKQYFGYTSFRTGQQELIDAAVAGRDVLGVMPTGGGKSLCYQIPALACEGVALVVSPLISLMEDQVLALRNAGVSAAYLASSLSADASREVWRGLAEGAYKILYIAPERLELDGFIALARRLPISLVAVDEAHCISQWGQDFRPSYLKILDFLDQLPRRPVVCAYTATATAQVREDIERILKLRDPLRVVTGFDRPNLNFEVLRPKNKTAALLTLVRERADKCGILYCATRNLVEQLCKGLCDAGVSATRYHAGLPAAERSRNQEDFLYDRRTVMVATNAFGMGIDKSNVGFVIHYNMPKSLEAYYQEAGRAGRDGEKADCLLLYSAGDIVTAKFFIQNSGENEELEEDARRAVMQQDYRRLDAMVGYCKTTACLRGVLLDYFGQTHEPHCGNCGNCRAHYRAEDITLQAQMVLSCVKRAKDKLGYCVGASLLAGCLYGSGEKRLVQLGLNGLTTYGLLKQEPRTKIRDYIEYLESEGYLHTDPAHGGVDLAPAAAGVLFRHEPVQMAVRETTRAEKVGGKKAAAPAPAAGEENQGLFTALKELRFRLAQQEGVPAYIIFSNATLADMAAKAPADEEALLTVSGVGEVKAKRYGKAFLEVIQETIQKEQGKHST